MIIKNGWDNMNVLEKAGVLALLYVGFALIELTIAVVIDLFRG